MESIRPPSSVAPEPISGDGYSKGTGNTIQYSFLKGAKELFTGGPMNILLFCVPVAFAVGEIKSMNPAVVFIFSLLSIAPLAERLGYVTEQLALHTNDTMGGLLNATFGNATELIVAIVALFRNEIRVVQLSLLGSILSNLLLVLGTAFFVGGCYHKVQTYSKISSHMNMILMMLCVMGLIFPSIMRETNLVTGVGQLYFSRAVCIYLFLVYACFLYFQVPRCSLYCFCLLHSLTYLKNIVQMFSHRHLFEGKDFEGDKSAGEREAQVGDIEQNLPEKRSTAIDLSTEKGTLAATPLAITNDEEKQGKIVTGEREEEDEGDEDVLGIRYAMLWLAIITVIIAFLSDYLVAAIEGTGKQWNLNPVFIAMIIIPLIGNAAEHAGAVVFAMKNKLDVTLGIAVGSSTQIGLMVLPLLVLIGWCADIDIDLNFQSFEAFSLFLCIVIVNFACKDGDSNWLTGVTLITAYFIVATAFFVHVPESMGE